MEIRYYNHYKNKDEYYEIDDSDVWAYIRKAYTDKELIELWWREFDVYDSLSSENKQFFKDEYYFDGTEESWQEILATQDDSYFDDLAYNALDDLMYNEKFLDYIEDEVAEAFEDDAMDYFRDTQYDDNDEFDMWDFLDRRYL